MAQGLKGKVEAVLFLTGRALSPAEIADKLLAPLEDVEEVVLELLHDYSCREDSALEIDDAEGYILQVKEEYADVVNRMVPIELSIGATRTLAALALAGPLLQSDLIKRRGSSAYDHIKELVEHQLVSKRRKEKSFLLNVTTKFHEYFKFSGDKDELKALAMHLAEEAAAETEGALLDENGEPIAEAIAIEAGEMTETLEAEMAEAAEAATESEEEAEPEILESSSAA